MSETTSKTPRTDEIIELQSRLTKMERVAGELAKLVDWVDHAEAQCIKEYGELCPEHKALASYNALINPTKEGGE